MGKSAILETSLQNGGRKLEPTWSTGKMNFSDKLVYWDPDPSSRIDPVRYLILQYQVHLAGLGFLETKLPAKNSEGI